MQHASCPTYTLAVIKSALSLILDLYEQWIQFNQIESIVKQNTIEA